MTSFRGPDGQEDMPYLLTPGPVTTSRDVKLAALADWNVLDEEFGAMVRDIRQTLLKIAGCDDSYVCIPVAGTESAGIEATLATLTPSKRKKTLIVSNGGNGQLAALMMERMGRPHIVMTRNANAEIKAQDVAKALDEDRNISHVWLVHCELNTGIVNSVAEISKEVKQRGRVMMLDANATFGGMPIHMIGDGIDVLTTCSHVCLASLSGYSFVLTRRVLLDASQGECSSIVLDLRGLWTELETTGQFRVAPLTHVLVALRQALRELMAEGGVAGRAEKYERNADTLSTRMRAMGFSPLLGNLVGGPIVQTYLCPRDAKFNSQTFYDGLRRRGFVIAPGLLSRKASFRLGTIGRVDEKLMIAFVAAVESVMADMDVRDFSADKD